MEFAHAVWHPGGAGPMPALFAIHGHGAHGQDLMGLAPFLGGGRAMLICPEAPYILQPGMLSYTWFDSAAAGRRSPEEFARITGLVGAFIDAAIGRYDVDPQRVALIGFSQGGSIVYHLGLAEPARWRGVAALSTWLPEETEAVADRSRVGDLTLLVQHGSQDPVVEVDRARDSRTRLEAMGARPDYREYPMAHQIANDSLRDLAAWTKQVLGID